MTDAVAQQARQHLLRLDGQEDVCLATYSISQGLQRATYLVNTLFLPADGERKVHGNASFTGDYILRVAAEAARTGHGLAMMHSHPVGNGWQTLSIADHTTEHGYAHIAHQYTHDALLGMTLTGGDNTWSARVWRPEATSPRWAESVRVVGPKLKMSWNS